MMGFSKTFSGTLITDTMLVGGVNDSDTSFEQLANFLAQMKPAKAYIALPIRPPAEAWVKPPDPATVNRAMQIISRQVDAEYLSGYEGNAFSSTGSIVEDLLSITAVHPMRKDAVEDLVKRTGGEWGAVERLVKEGRMVETEYEGWKYYLRMRPCAHDSTEPRSTG